MGRCIDENLWNAWRQRLARYGRWSGTVAGFCDRERVSAVAFYQWRRKLGAVRAVNDAGRGSRAELDVAPRFLPVRIESAEPVEIELPNGVLIRVPVGASRALEAVIAAAARCDATSSTQEARAC